MYESVQLNIIGKRKFNNFFHIRLHFIFDTSRNLTIILNGQMTVFFTFRRQCNLNGSSDTIHLFFN